MSEILLICRACLTESDHLLPIFKTVVEYHTGELLLYELMKELTGLKIKSDDDMPQTVCQNCADEIARCYNFRKQCIESDSTLKSTLGIDDDAIPQKEEMILKKTIKLETDFNVYDENSGNAEFLQPGTETNDTMPPQHDLDIRIKENIENDIDDEVMYDEYEVLEPMDDYDGDEHDINEQKYNTANLVETKYAPSKTHDGEFEKFLSCFSNTISSDMAEITDSNSCSNYSGESDTATNDGITKLHIPNRCVLCNDSFDTADELKLHLEKHLNDPQYECKLCQLSFKRARAYQNHMRLHKENSAHDCNFCGKDLDGMTTESVNAHIASHKPELIDGGFLCFFCETKFKQNKDRKRHMTIKHMDLCFKYRDQLLKVINDQQDDLKKMSILCDICGEEFTSALSLKLHLVHHTGEKPYECPTCGKRFATESYLKDHSIRHNAIKMFGCEKCGKGFARKRALKDHIKRHDGIRPFECHICNTKLSTRASLQMHIRTHNGEKPYREQEQRRAPRIRTKKKKQLQTIEHSTESFGSDILYIE